MFRFRKRTPEVPVNDFVGESRKIGVRIGDHCEIHPSVSWGSEPYLISVGNHVRITKNVQFITHDGGVWVLRELYQQPNLDLFGRIQVGNNVHIGLNAIIAPGVSIGDNCVIATGAVVTKDIPAGEVWGGVPAHFIESIDQYYEKNKERFVHSKQLSMDDKRKLIEKYLAQNDPCIK